MATSRRSPEERNGRAGPGRVKISELARLSGVTRATVKHYIHEGLVRPLAEGRNIAWFDPEQAPQIRAIKAVQKAHFLPLKVIRDLMEAGVDLTDELAVAAAIDGALEKGRDPESRTRSEILDNGVSAEQLGWLERAGLLRPQGRSRVYSGDDLALLKILGGAQKAGLAPPVIPMAFLSRYVEALSVLVKLELEVFVAEVMPVAGERLPQLTESANVLAERLILLLRRKLLLPLFEQVVAGPRKGRKAPVRGRGRARSR